tara:strand:- start:1349 stop:2746 length:1398 start_codon:yes stop_codon:yes gene_type:complete
MSVSEALSYYSNVLSGFSTTSMRLTTSSKSSNIIGGDVTVFPLPSNSLCSLDSFKVFFQCAVTGTTARLPPGISSLLRRVEIVCGGVTLSEGTNLYSTLLAAKSALCGPKDNKASGNPYLVHATDEFSGLAIATTSPQPLPSASAFIGTQEASYCIDDFSNTFLGSVSPAIFDMGLIPDVNVVLYWNDNSVLTTSTTVANPTSLFSPEGSGFTEAVAANATYVVNRIHATIECISLADSSFDQMIASQMASAGFIEAPFKSYQCFSEGTASGTSRFQVATQSLDRIWVGYRFNATSVTGGVSTGRQYPHAVQGPPIPVLGYFPCPTMETRHGTSKERYTTAQQCFRVPGPDFNLQWTLNGSQIPQTPIFGSELMSFTKSQLDESDYMRDDLTAAEYMSSAFVTCLRLNMPHTSSRLQSGLDTRASSLQGLVRTLGGTPNNYDAFLAIESSPTLRIMPGRSVAVVP